MNYGQSGVCDDPTSKPTPLSSKAGGPPGGLLARLRLGIFLPIRDSERLRIIRRVSGCVPPQYFSVLNKIPS